jgi:hypothetical protein
VPNVIYGTPCLYRCARKGFPGRKRGCYPCHDRACQGYNLTFWAAFAINSTQVCGQGHMGILFLVSSTAVVLLA